MSLTPAQARQLDQLATAALDAVRDQDRAAVAVATGPEDNPRARALHRQAVKRAERAELALFDAIHALVTHRVEHHTNGRLEAFLRH